MSACTVSFVTLPLSHFSCSYQIHFITQDVTAVMCDSPHMPKSRTSDLKSAGEWYVVLDDAGAIIYETDSCLSPAQSMVRSQPWFLQLPTCLC